MIRRIFCLVLTIACLGLPAHEEQGLSSGDWAALAGNEYRIISNVVYKVANNYEARLDVYLPRGTSKPYPTVIYIHGGGWVGGSKETSILRLMPYIEKGMAVVNVAYRLARVSRAPAAVEDCRCALRWVIEHAGEHGFDTSKLVVTGHSAGGHLSLMTGMLDSSAGLDNDCPGAKPLRVAAVVNYYGITDVADLLDGANRKEYAVRWLGSLADRGGVARQASPLTYVRSELPAILTIHGDADPTVPYQHAVRLHKALDEKNVANQLLTIPGGKHGGFSRDETLQIQKTINAFLKKHGVID